MLGRSGLLGGMRGRLGIANVEGVGDGMGFLEL